MVRRKRRPHSLFNKKNSKQGRISFVLALLSLVCFVAAVAYSFVKSGKGGGVTGWLGALSLVLSLGGFIVGLTGFSNRDKDLFYSWLGSILNAVIWLMYAGMYLAYL